MATVNVIHEFHFGSSLNVTGTLGDVVGETNPISPKSWRARFETQLNHLILVIEAPGVEAFQHSLLLVARFGMNT